LHRKGQRVAAVARHTKQAVSQHLRNAGIDATARRARRPEAPRRRLERCRGRGGGGAGAGADRAAGERQGPAARRHRVAM